MPENDSKQYRCTLPSSHLNITARGAITPCCNFEWTATDYYKEPKNTPHNQFIIDTFRIDKHNYHWIQDAGIGAVLHSKDWHQMRKKSAMNVPESGCKNCYFSEKASNSSRRLWANDKFPTADSETKLRSLELKLGAKCNLECRSCSGAISNKLLREDSYLNSGKIDKTHIRQVQALSSWVQDDKVWDEIKSVSSDLEYIQFTGGEPMIIPQQYAYLEWLAENNIDPAIQYITNGTVGVDDYKKQLWDNFSSLTIDFSLDATTKLGEYIRTGSVWDEQIKNVDSVVSYMIDRKQNQLHSELGIAITVSIMNVTNIRAIMDYVTKVNEKYCSIGTVSTSINIVRKPEWQDCANLIGEAKEIATQHIQSVIDDERYAHHHRMKLYTVLDEINLDPTSDVKFTDKIAEKDRVHNLINTHRDISYQRELPEWWETLLRSGM